MGIEYGHKTSAPTKGERSSLDREYEQNSFSKINVCLQQGAKNAFYQINVNDGGKKRQHPLQAPSEPTSQLGHGKTN